MRKAPANPAVLDAALTYLAQGYSVIPCKRGEKVPAIASWKEYQDAAPTEPQAHAWWGGTPDANIAIVTGKVSNLTVIDVDGQQGLDSLAAAKIVLPTTRVIKTPHGWHLYYRYNPEFHTGAGFLPGLDVRSDGGYVVAPPSTVAETAYVVFRDHPIADIPLPSDAFRGRSRNGHTPERPGAEPVRPAWVTEALTQGAGEGRRNETAARLIGYFHGLGMAKDIIATVLATFAAKCRPPMDGAELHRTIESVTRYSVAVKAARLTDPPDPMRKEGDTYILSWPIHGITVRASTPYEGRDGLHTNRFEVLAQAPGMALVQYGPIRTNLSSASARESITKALGKRFVADWDTIIDTVARLIIADAETLGEVKDLRSFRERRPTKWVIEPLILEGHPNLWFGPGGCVAGDTIMQTPDGDFRIDDLARRGKPIRVWALSEHGPVVASATAPFMEGYDHLFKFVMADGQSIVVTQKHRFLTPQGWRFARDLHVGDCVAVASSRPQGCGLSPARSTWDTAPSALPEGGPRCSQTAAGLQAHCSAGSRLCGPQPRWGEDTDPVVSPSRGGARGRTRGGLRADGLGFLPASSQVGASAHHARNSYALASPSLATVESLTGAWRYAQPWGNTSTRQQSHQGCAHQSPVGVPHLPAAAAADGPYIPPFSGTNRYCSVTAIAYQGYAPYYDLEVPVYENYLANGVWNHNTLKSLFALTSMLAIQTTEGRFLHMEPSAFHTGLYLDWEFDEHDHGERFAMLCQGIGRASDDTPLHYLRMSGSLTSQLTGVRRALAETGASFVVIDSVGAACGGQPSKDEFVLPFFDALRSLNITSLLIGHEAKSELSKGHPYGNQAWESQTRNLWEIKRHQDSGDPTVHVAFLHRKGNSSGQLKAIGFAVQWSPDAIRIVQEAVTDTPELSKSLPIRDRLIAMLRGGEQTTSELAEELDAEEATVRTVLNRYKDLFVRDGPLWRLRNSVT